jgi:hypothetical protein
VYGDKVLNAISLELVDYGDITITSNTTTKFTPKFIGVLAINENGNLVIIHDEAWRFQFIPIISKGGTE